LNEKNSKNENESEPPMVEFQKLPENWIRPTITGDISYDETVREINNQLKRTIVIYLIYLF
jgi:hypothetical protein